MASVTGRGRTSARGEAATTELPEILLCVPATDRGRFVDAFRRQATLVSFDSLDAVMPYVSRAAHRIAAAVVTPRDSQGNIAVPVVRQLAHSAPRTALIAYCEPGVGQSGDIRALAAAGIHEFLFRGIDDSRIALRDVINRATQERAAEAVLRVLEPLLPESLHEFVEVCTTRPAEVQTVNQAARLLGVDRKTLANYCARAGTLTPAELLGWCRILLAAEVLDSTGQTVEAVALELEWASVTSLRNMMKRYTGARATEVCTRGGLAFVAGLFAARLHAGARAPIVRASP